MLKILCENRAKNAGMRVREPCENRAKNGGNHRIQAKCVPKMSFISKNYPLPTFHIKKPGVCETSLFFFLVFLSFGYGTVFFCVNG